jgi:ubiquinone/menaquinone biosynthesis C-methylase UbiE
VGAGTDFLNWVRQGAIATGLDLTEKSVALTQERLALEGLSAQVLVGDAEALPFPEASFDLVYAYGVLHHSPDTPKAVAEVGRVLVPGGTALVMLYHVPSWTGWMLWTLHSLGRLQPWRGLRWAIFHHLESPGTKAYTQAEARRLFQGFSRVHMRTQLGNGDLLNMRPTARYSSRAHRILWALYPRWLVRRIGNRFGVCLLIEATK